MVDYINNLRGDDNYIKVDKSVSDHPIIKYVGSGNSSGNNTPVKGDADIQGALPQKSITVQTLSSDLSGSTTQNVAQLYNFRDGASVPHTIDPEHPSLTGDGGAAEYAFLLRKKGAEGNELEYADISWTLSSAQLEPLKITVDGVTTEYDGTVAQTVNIDTGGGGGGSTLTIQKNGNNIATYDGSTDVTANITIESGEGALSSITVYGTDGNYATTNSDITFESEDDSNITVKAESDGQGGVTLKVGVYYI